MSARSAYPDYLWEWAADRADQDGLTAAAVDQRFGYLMSVAVDKNSELVPQIRPDWDLIVRLRRDLGVENLAKLWPPTPDTFLKHMRTVRKATKETQISGTLIESNGNLRLRLQRLLENLWVPDAEQMPIDYFKYGPGFNIAPTMGRDFRWQQEGSKVVRCWLSDEEDRWLRDEVFGCLHNGDHLAMAYDKVQREACDYVNKAARYNFHLVTGCGNYPLWEVWSWHDNGTVIKTKPESTEGGRRVSVLKRQEGAPVLLG